MNNHHHNSNYKLQCSNCNTEVTPIPKVLDVKVCPNCNIILESGRYSMEKVS